MRQICRFVLFFALFANVTFAVQQQPTELQKLQETQTELRKQIADRTKVILDGNQLSTLRHQIEMQRGQQKEKDQAIKDWISPRLDKNPEFTALLNQEKEYNALTTQCRTLQKELRADPEIQKLEKEAADLRAQAKAKTDAATKLHQEKCQASPAMKALEAKQTAMGNIGKKVSDFRSVVLSDKEYLSMKSGMDTLIREIMANDFLLRQTTMTMTKEDAALNDLQAKLKSTTDRMAELRKAPPAPAPSLASPSKNAPADSDKAPAASEKAPAPSTPAASATAPNHQ